MSADPGPPEPPAVRIARIRPKAPILLKLATEPIRQADAAGEAAQIARARRVGRDLGVVDRSDYGHLRADRSSCIPRSIVLRARPVAIDVAVTPPWLSASASLAAASRRPR